MHFSHQNKFNHSVLAQMRFRTTYMYFFHTKSFSRLHQIWLRMIVRQSFLSNIRVCGFFLFKSWSVAKSQKTGNAITQSFTFWGEFTIILSKKKKALMFPMICLLTFIEEWTVGPWQRSTEPSSLFSAPFLWNGLSWKAWLVLVTMLLTQ